MDQTQTQTQTQKRTIMSAPQNSQKKQIPVASLLSTPETTRLDIFNSPSSVSISRTLSASSGDVSARLSIQAVASKHTAPSLLSPPISPESKTKQHTSAEDEGAADPVLFSSQGALDPTTVPLFPQPDQEAAIQHHIAIKGPVCDEKDYQATIDFLSNIKFQSIVGEHYNRNPRGWWQHSLNTMKYYEDLRREEKAKAATKPAPKSRLKPLLPAPEGGLRKRVNVPRIQRTPRIRKSLPHSDTGDSPSSAREPAAKPVSKAPTNRDDVDYASVRDYCPSTNNLDVNPRQLKADWKGQLLDMSTDPDLHMLHAAEVNLASTLRLTGAVYLTSKRRIFRARVECLQRGKEFRKTDAQQACKIDVNKASKLWTAFERVGWFEPRHFDGLTA